MEKQSVTKDDIAEYLNQGVRAWPPVNDEEKKNLDDGAFRYPS